MFQMYYRSIFELLQKKRISSFGTLKYKKFAVITRSRTGSNLLISLLNSHPQIEANGEVFSSVKNRNCNEIWNTIFSKKSKRIQLVGFKIFYYHPNESDDKEVWELLKNDKTIKIVHLRRENKLRTHVSRLIAGKLDVWKSQNILTPVKEKKVEIEIEELLKDFHETESYEFQTRRDFLNHPFLELTYESLVKDKESLMQAILKFMEVDWVSLESSLRKQNSETLEELIHNYDDIKACLNKTRYSNFFDEEPIME